MTYDNHASFYVFHGTEAKLIDLKDGLSGHPGYDNLALDPFSSLGYGLKDLNQPSRVSVWVVEANDIKPKYNRKHASINRQFTADEKKNHFLTFKRAIETTDTLPVEKDYKTPEKIIADEAERVNGIPGEKLALMIEFTKDQREYLSKSALGFCSELIELADNGHAEPMLDELEKKFIESCPEVEKLKIFDKNGNLIDSSKNIATLVLLYRQSLLATAHSLQFGDQMSFEAGLLFDLKYNNLLKKEMEYYMGRGRGYEIWSRLVGLAKSFENQLLFLHPEMSPVVGKI